MQLLVSSILAVKISRHEYSQTSIFENESFGTTVSEQATRTRNKPYAKSRFFGCYLLPENFLKIHGEQVSSDLKQRVTRGTGGPCHPFRLLAIVVYL